MNKEEVLATIQSLTVRLDQLTEKRKIYSEISVKIKQIRQKAVTECLAELLPNLNPWSIETLRNEVPDFSIPTITYFFGIFERIDPNTSIDSLRADLEEYLETSPFETSKIWEKYVGYYNRSIYDMEVNFIRPNDTQIIGVKVLIHQLGFRGHKREGRGGIIYE